MRNYKLYITQLQIDKLSIFCYKTWDYQDLGNTIKLLLSLILYSSVIQFVFKYNLLMI